MNDNFRSWIWIHLNTNLSGLRLFKLNDFSQKKSGLDFPFVYPFVKNKILE